MICFTDRKLCGKPGDTMETVKPHQCEKCGQSFSGHDIFVSHPCSKRLTLSSSKRQLGNYKCSQCNEVFSKPAALKHHFKTIHSGHIPKGLFPCTEQGCQFSSTDHQEYQAHLTSTHGLTLIPCTFRSCKVSLPTQEHNHLPTCPQGNKTTSTTVCTTVSHQPQASSRPKRKLKSNPAYASSLPEDGHKEQPEREGHNIKRVRKAVERDSPLAVDAVPLKSKEYLAEGAEHIYRTNTCPACRRCFKMRSHLQEHLHLHFPDPSLQCPTCKRYFTSKSKLRIHRLREAGEKVHHCHLCEYSAVERNAIRRHLVSMHADEADDGTNGHNYPCPTCGQSFHQSRSLKAHMKIHNILPDSKPVACFQEGCSFQSSLRKELLRHTVEVHGVKAVECRHHACGAIFQKETDMETHYRTHLAYHCSECDFSCSNKTVFLQHQRHGHPGNDRLCCDFCSFVTFNPVEFEQHIGRLHANEKIHRCSQCSYMTSHKRGLKRHMLMHSGDKPHKCSLCDFRCRDESYLSKHMLTHSDNKNFMCAECGYVTKWKHYLNVHMRKHAGDLRYHCDQCPYRCHRMDQLNSHKLRHQAKSLMCEICAYACKRKYELRNHMLAKHSGEEKPPSVYKCKFCTYTTCYRQALQNHENCKHTRVKEFHCALCFYSSFSSISLFLHKRKAHGTATSDSSQEKADTSTSTSSSEEDNVAVPHEECDLSDLDDSYEPLNNSASLPVEPGKCQTPEVQGDGETVGSVLPPEQNQPLESEVRLKAMKKHDKEQAEAMVLEGRVQMLVVQTKDIYRCDKCSYVTFEETALKYHCQALCRGKIKEHKCQACGAQFKQRRGLDSHLAKKCPALPRKRRTFVGISNTCLVEQESSSQGKKGSTNLAEGTKSDQTELLSSQNRDDQEFHQQEEEHCTFTCKQERCMAQHVALKHKGVRPHSCRYCPFATTRRYRLEEHESLHTGIGRHKCDMCSKTFGAVTKLRQHKMRIHDKQPTHFCSLCDFSGYTLDDVRRHNLRCHTGELGHACTHCDTRFSSEIALKNHCKRVHQLQVCFSCKQCDYTCSSEVMLKTHQQSKHCQVKCTTCQESFETKENLEIHQRTHLAHQCQLCPFAAKTKQLLAQHLLKEHEEGSLEDKPLKCSTCQFACQHQLVFEQHLRSHGGKRLYKCMDCEYSTRNKQKMTWHIRIHTGEKPYSCEQCSYTCTDPSRLKLHMRVHQEEKKYLCPECGYKCKWATQLKYHMTKHTGEKPYACEECDYRTNRADALRAHRDTQHCDMRPYVCEKCGKAFKTSFILKTHQRQHSDDRPYVCGLCDKAFRWPAGLRHHYLSHTKQQPFCCRHCSYRAKQKFQVVKHLQRHHPEMSVEQGVVKDSEALSLTLKEALQGTLGERAVEVEEEGKAIEVAVVVVEEVQRGEDNETKH
ncbi:zinc finger protein 142 [Lates japonicus]|uniref:Zinc finger protein 142 n=1 Tax=Lates japonicus TaxID=270547 RepID=A0AAD3R1H2_LATJO|nr:zinc finger protein 142 [Lates japonicus]